jgi:hypothetical protein
LRDSLCEQKNNSRRYEEPSPNHRPTASVKTSPATIRVPSHINAAVPDDARPN